MSTHYLRPEHRPLKLPMTITPHMLAIQGILPLETRLYFQTGQNLIPKPYPSVPIIRIAKLDRLPFKTIRNQRKLSKGINFLS